MKETTYKLNDVYNFLKDTCNFPAIASELSTKFRYHPSIVAIPESELKAFFSEHFVTGDVIIHYWKLLEASCVGHIDIPESKIDIDAIAQAIASEISYQGCGLIDGYDFELNDNMIEVVGVDFDESTIKNVIIKILNQKLNK